MGAGAYQQQVGDLSQGSTGNPSGRWGGAPIGPPSLRRGRLATLHPDVPRVVLLPEVPGLQHPTHPCSQCPSTFASPGILPSFLHLHQLGTPPPHPAGTGIQLWQRCSNPTPTSDSQSPSSCQGASSPAPPTGPTRVGLQLLSAAVPSPTFHPKSHRTQSPYWDPQTPRHLRYGKRPGHLIQPHSCRKDTEDFHSFHKYLLGYYYVLVYRHHPRSWGYTGEV